MDEKQLQALANELAKNLKTPDDLNQFDRLLKKISVKAALNAEMTHHLGYDKNQPKPATNARNGYTQKTVITGDGPLEPQLKQKLNEDEVGQRLLTIPCVGTLTASTISTELGDGKHYASSRDFAAATGLVPRQYSTGGRTTLLGISKRGNKKIRTLLVQCARVFIQKLEHQKGKLAEWVRELLCRKSNFVVTCALANKLARIAWALTTRQQTFAS